MVPSWFPMLKLFRVFVDYGKLRYVYTSSKNHAISIHSRCLYVSINYRGLNNVVIYEKTTRKAKTLARNRVIARVFDCPIDMILGVKG
jgi:hypothetical protein